ncbi:MAG: substrate-binding domain-containing protein, partial [Propionibacteriaceae bacterium]|nr:substrate-binding domain-containing protein [Propionibacteriaceae bacterium]
FSANDPDAACGALKEAMDAGIKVVTFDSDTSCRDLFINQVEGEGIAKALVDMVIGQIGDAGEVAWLSAGANATNQNAWMEMANSIFAEDYPNIKIVDTVYGDDADQPSFDKTAALLATYPNLGAIIAPTAVGLPAAARYISASEFKGKVALTGLAVPSAMKSFIEDGTVTEFALWNPIDLGYLSVFAAKALIEGTITGAEGDTFAAGRLGEYTVGPDATVLLGDPYRFNKDNINNFDF